MLLNGFLKMLHVMCCCQHLFMLLLAVGVFVRILKSREGERGVKKQPACTWSEVNNEVHVFVADDQDHPEMIEIQAELQRLSTLMHAVCNCD
jgi:hypothetical protein